MKSGLEFKTGYWQICRAFPNFGEHLQRCIFHPRDGVISRIQTALALTAFIACLIPAQPVQAAPLNRTIKTFSYRNTTGLTADSVTLVLGNPLPDVGPKGAKGASNQFTNAVISDDRRRITFTGGILKPGDKDSFTMELGSWRKGQYPIAAMIVTEGTNQTVIADSTPKEFEESMTGFTQDEYYDQSGSNVLLHIGVGVPGLNIQYTLTNLRVYTNLSEANFDLNSYTSVGSAVPLIQISSCTITSDGSNDLNLFLGAPVDQRYELAMVDSLTVTDLQTQDSFTTGPMYFAQDYIVSMDTPLPRWVQAGIILGILLISWRRLASISGPGPDLHRRAEYHAREIP
jgi:hypothetical protein